MSVNATMLDSSADMATLPEYLQIQPLRYFDLEVLKLAEVKLQARIVLVQAAIKAKE
jgi:hypothetical protein